MIWIALSITFLGLALVRVGNQIEATHKFLSYQLGQSAGHVVAELRKAQS